MAARVVIVDYGTGNLNSIHRCLDRMRIDSIVSSEPGDIVNSDKIILPGVGHFRKAMETLRALNLVDTLHEAVLVKKKPILGLCLGMQLMARRSEEGNAKGLGWFDAELISFDISNKLKYKIPQFGWNRIHIRKDSMLMNNISDQSEFYFAHRYHLRLADSSDVLSETRYEHYYPSAIEKDNIFGVQYHPEKSHDVGAQLLSNFVKL